MKTLLDRSGKIVPILLVAIGCILFLYLVGARDLWAPDEDEYAQISREMIRSGDWIIPTCNGEAWTIKPVLLNWLISAISLPWGDVNEFRARVFSSLAALGTFMLTFLLGKRLFSQRAGILSALVLGTSVVFLEQARWVQTYMLSTFFSTLAIVAFYIGYTTPLRRTPAYLVMYAAAGFGVLTMGPVNLAMPGLVCFTFIVIRKDLWHLKEMRIVRGAVLFLAIAAPWYIVMANQEGYGFDLLIKTNLGRYLNTWTHSQPFYYYVPDLSWTFAPWSFFLPGALLLAFSSRRLPEHKQGITLALVWFFSLLLFFSFADGKRSQYLLGAYPALALLVGYLLDRSLESWPEAFFRKAIIIPSILLAALWAVLTIAGPVAAWILGREWLIPALGLSVVTATFSGCTFRAWRRDRPQQLVLLPVAFMLVLVLYGVHVLLPRAEPYKSVRAYCEVVRSHLDRDPDMAWGMYKSYRAVYVYYADHFTTKLSEEEELEAFLSQPNPTLVIVQARHYDKLKDTLLADAEILDKRQIGSRDLVLVTRRPGSPVTSEAGQPDVQDPM